MSNATLRFTTHWPYNPISLLVACCGRSKYFSHCMLIIDDYAYEATMLHGCRKVPVAEAMQGVMKYQDMPLTIPNLEAAQTFGESQIGKRYDYAGVLGIPLLASDDWADDSKWWCSELNYMMLHLGGIDAFDLEIKTRVTPEDLRMMNYTKSAIISKI